MIDVDGMVITVLGSGTSAGVPMIGCHCAVCRSADGRDKRTRPSIAVHYGGKHVLVDTTPELRLQAVANGLDHVDAVVFTHAHADHIFGLDDVRRYNSILGGPLPLYADGHTLERLESTFPYAFIAQQGEFRVFRPEITPAEIRGAFDLFGKRWQPVPLVHGRGNVLGFRVDDFAYCTDCSSIPAESLEMLRGLDVLIIDALRPAPHPTHLSFEQALGYISELKPRRAFFTHLSHDIGHAAAEADLPGGVRVCYDGMRIELAGE